MIDNATYGCIYFSKCKNVELCVQWPLELRSESTMIVTVMIIKWIVGCFSSSDPVETYSQNLEPLTSGNFFFFRYSVTSG